MTIPKNRIAEIAAIADEDIDTSEIPEITEDFFKEAKLVAPGTMRRRRRSPSIRPARRKVVRNRFDPSA